MGRTSTVRRLPPELREQIHDLMEKGCTLDEIKAVLDDLNAGVSRTALHRYRKSLSQINEAISRCRAVADALVKRLGDAPENKTARLNIEILHSAVMDLLMGGEDGTPAILDPQKAMLLSKALDHLSKASRNDAEQQMKLREQIRKEEEAKLQKALKQAGAECNGLSAADALARVRAIYRGEA